LSGGGDAPGINAVLRAIVRKAIQDYAYETVGIKDGWQGLIEGEFIPLDLKTIVGMLPKGRDNKTLVMRLHPFPLLSLFSTDYD
jgi:6-phosphofructokinase